MKTKLHSLLILIVLACLAGVYPVAGQGTAFTYQGQLSSGTNLADGSFDITLTLFKVSSGGSKVGSILTNTAVGVTNGLFLVTADFGSVFDGTSYWLQIGVRTNGGGAFIPLSPRETLTPTPYAITAENVTGAVSAGQLPGSVVTNNASGVNLTGTLGGNGGGLTNLNAANLTGTIADAQLPGDAALLDEDQTFTGINKFKGTNQSIIINGGPIGTNLFTGLGFQYNSGSGEGAIMSSYNDDRASLTFYTKQGPGYPIAEQVKIDRYGTVMIDQQNNNNGVLNDGTTNGVGLTFGTSSGAGIASQRTPGVNQNGLDFYTGSSHQMSILHNGNIGMGITNPGTALQVSGTVTANAFAGNGSAVSNLNASQLSSGVIPNSVLSGFQAGYDTVSGGSNNTAFGFYSTVGGGFGNEADGLNGDTVGGGTGNSAIGIDYSTVGGGQNNTVSGLYYAGTVGGGSANMVTAGYATIPGGSRNLAGGTYSFAAGQQAQATNQGAFVWADSQNAPFASTANDSFNVRAQGGANFVTGDAGLTVNTGVAGTVQLISESDNIVPSMIMANNNAYSGHLRFRNYLEVQPNLAHTSAGGVDVRNTNGSATITLNGANGNIASAGGLNIDQTGTYGGNTGTVAGNALTFGTGPGGSGEGIASKRVGTDPFDLEFYTAFVNRMTILSDGNVGMGTTNPISPLEVEGDVRIDDHALLLNSDNDNDDSANGLQYLSSGLTGVPGGAGPFLFGYEGGALGTVQPTEVNLSWDPNGNVWVNANLSTATLTIRGGADLAEPFNITADSHEVPQGAVVVIDDQNPGQLKMTDQPYDTRVAGVISGANGINPGIQMHQQGLLEGGKNVALTGRVYVQADASNGAIRPGDMLTTSSSPGRAMRVTDHARAQGAILGKAMTSLSEGKGMVLVLVTLQ